MKRKIVSVMAVLLLLLGVPSLTGCSKKQATDNKPQTAQDVKVKKNENKNKKTEVKKKAENKNKKTEVKKKAENKAADQTKKTETKATEQKKSN